MRDGAAERIRQLRHVDDHLLVVDVDDGLERDAVVAAVLDVDEQLVAASGTDVAHGAEFLVPAFGEYLETDANALVPSWCGGHGSSSKGHHRSAPSSRPLLVVACTPRWGPGQN